MFLESFSMIVVRQASKARERTKYSSLFLIFMRTSNLQAMQEVELEDSKTLSGFILTNVKHYKRVFSRKGFSRK